MVHLYSFITDLAKILIIAGVITLIFRKLKIPALLGYIVAGFLASPNFIQSSYSINTEDVKLWAEIGVIFLLFAIGLEFSFKKIIKIGGSSIITALTVICTMVITGYSTGLLMGWGKMDSMFLGGMISMSSTMVIMKTYEEYRLKKKKFASLVMGTLVIEDLGGVFMIIILSTIAVGKATEGMAVAVDIAKLMALLVVWTAVGIFLIPTFLNKISKIVNDELLLIISLALCFGMVFIGVKLGFSSALGAFMTGSIIAGTVHAGRIEKLTRPLKDLFGAIFFVSVGTMLNLSLVVKHIVPILIITALTIIGQMLFSTIGMLLAGQSLHTAIKGGSSMVQIGEFSFIIAVMGTNLNVTSDFLYPIVVCVSVITSFVTPIFILTAEKRYSFIRNRIPKAWENKLARYTSERRSDADKDRDWQKYITRFFQRVIFCTAGLAAIYLLGTRAFQPFMDDYIPEGWSDVVAAVTTCILMIPVITALCFKKNVLFTKLWLKNDKNKIPLITFDAIKFIVAVGFIMLTLRKLLHLPYIAMLLVAVVIIGLAVKSDFVKSTALRLELRFVGNMNEEMLAREKEERFKKDRTSWLDEKMYVVQFGIKYDIENNDIRDFGNNRWYHVTIIKIIRDKKRIVMPGPSEKILKGDIIHALGTKVEVDACVLQCQREKYISEPENNPVTLREYIYGQIFSDAGPDEQLFCVPVKVTGDSQFKKKAIKNSQFRPIYKGYIVGIERWNADIINPDINMIIEEGDIIWAVGNKHLCDRILKAGIWDAEERAHIRQNVRNRCG